MSIMIASENIGAWWITVEINYVRTHFTFTRAREMPFGGRQCSRLFCLVQKPFKLIFCFSQDLLSRLLY